MWIYLFIVITSSPCALRLLRLKRSFCLRQADKTVEINISPCVFYTQTSLKHWGKMPLNLFEWIVSHCQACAHRLIVFSWRDSHVKQEVSEVEKIPRTGLKLDNDVEPKARLSPLTRHCLTLLEINWKVVLFVLIDSQFRSFCRSAKNK